MIVTPPYDDFNVEIGQSQTETAMASIHRVVKQSFQQPAFQNSLEPILHAMLCYAML